MGLFSKKEDKGIPKVPPLPKFSEVQGERGLPSLPHNFSEGMDRNIIKSAVNEGNNPYDEDEEERASIPSVPESQFQPSQIPNVQENKHERFLPSSSELKEPPKIERPSRGMEGPDSIFVRIDKFKAARKEIDGIKKDLLEAEAIINKLNEIKTKEDSEFKEINLNLETIKKKIGEVDSLVFDKV